MKKIAVQSLPLFEVLKDIADAFNTTYTENCGEYHLDIPEALGEGYIKAINFDGGLGILIYHCTFKEEMQFHFVVNEVHPLKFLYCLKGKLEHKFQNNDDLNTIEQYQSSIVASKDNNGHILHFSANEETNVGSLEINREKFQVKMNCELKSLTPELVELFRDKIASKQFYHNGFYSLRIADLFTNIEEFENNDFIRRLFLEGNAYQILTNQIIQYHDDLNSEDSRSLLRHSELKLIDKAARLIEDDISLVDTVDALAEKVGINVNKLQAGFKHSFKLTVNSYVQMRRLERAKELLKNTELNISEIVDQIGLSSKSYFSKMFKESYGITPRDFRQNNRNLLKK